MTRLVVVNVTVLVSDDVDEGSLGDVLVNVAEAPVAEWAEVNGWEADVRDAYISTDIPVEEY
jgi:hypothetical protein